MTYEEAKQAIGDMYYEEYGKQPSDSMIRIAVGVISPEFFKESILEEMEEWE